ncbi:conserved exported hypothetical protein [Nitrosotalea sinensis]|jgi:hypothetical protein|uniref:Uncharacterized protein n=2 Tax=Nitrosotalea sinensis TaxID=1499975 RepID=A0A2H1EGL9_9ARCH|nr:conserved exported hypothetical protein [Candidatus Nitrosotalea sinensis]
MMAIRSIGRVLVLVASGIAIVVVGGFMIGAVAKLYLPGRKKDKHKPPEKLYERKKTD